MYHLAWNGMFAPVPHLKSQNGLSRAIGTINRVGRLAEQSQQTVLIHANQLVLVMVSIQYVRDSYI